MKKLFRASYGDESKVYLILADSLNEAIGIANKDDDENGFAFDEDSVFEISLNQKDSQIIEKFTVLNHPV